MDPRKVGFCKTGGASDPKTMGSCPKVGLIAHKAEENGSHSCTFEVKGGAVCIAENSTNRIVLGHKIKVGGNYRYGQTKCPPIKD